MNHERAAQLESLFRDGKARLAHTLGLTLTFDDSQRAIITMPYLSAYDNSQEHIHGGIYMTLLDSAAWFAAAVYHEDSIWVATSELTVHLLKPVRESALRAVGTLIQGGRRLDIAEAHLYDEADRLVGHAVGTFVVLPQISTADN